MRGANSTKTERARRLRREPTDAEKKLWNRHLRARGLGGYKLVRQEPIGPYIVDFRMSRTTPGDRGSTAGLACNGHAPMPCATSGLQSTAIAFCGFGTTTSCATWTACWRRIALALDRADDAPPIADRDVPCARTRPSSPPLAGRGRREPSSRAPGEGSSPSAATRWEPPSPDRRRYAALAQRPTSPRKRGEVSKRHRCADLTVDHAIRHSPRRRGTRDA